MFVTIGTKKVSTSFQCTHSWDYYSFIFIKIFNKKFSYLYFANFAEKIDSRDEVERAPDRHRTNGYVEGGSEANKFRGQFEEPRTFVREP